ncbi:MAG: diadenylate cyclase CdaA [Arcticibacter sp.]
MDLFKIGFLDIRLLDLIDILLVAFLIYKLYELIKGGVAMNIVIGLLSIYFIWWFCVNVLEMHLIGAVLGQFIGVGVIALIIVFQQEVRRFLIMLGTNSFLANSRFAQKLKNWSIQTSKENQTDISPIVKACLNMGKTKTGALIVISRNTDLKFFANTGDLMEAEVSKRLIESIFFKNSPMHDGAIIISGNRIKAARCVLPVTDNPDIPAQYGMRHRAGLGISEQTDAIAVIVSEETGRISIAIDGELKPDMNAEELQSILEKEL